MSTPAAIFDAIKALVGNRVYSDEAPQDAALPFVVYRLTAQQPIRTLDGALHANIDTYSVDIWAETRVGAEALHPQVRDAMHAAAIDSTYQGLTWGADVEMGFEGCSMEFVIVDRNP